MLLKDKETDINVLDGWGNTPLYWACYRGRLDIVKCLLFDERIDFTIKNKYKSTPFNVVTSNKKYKLIKYFVVYFKLKGKVIDTGRSLSDKALFDDLLPKFLNSEEYLQIMDEFKNAQLEKVSKESSDIYAMINIYQDKVENQ